MKAASMGSKESGLRYKQEDARRGDKPEECPVCMTPFDDVVQRPRNLPCGHTFCTTCINGLKEQGRVTCPTCRTIHAVPESGQFPISYITEALIKRLQDSASIALPPKAGKDAKEPTLLSLGRSDLKAAASLSSAIRSMLHEQEEKVSATIQGCQELRWQLDHYQTTLEIWREEQQYLEDRLQTLVDRSKSARVLVCQEESHVTDKKEKVLQGEQQQHDLLQTLRTVTSRQEAFEAIDEADRLADSEMQRTEEWQQMFPEEHIVTTIRRIRLAARVALEAVQAIEEALDIKSAVETENTVDTEDTVNTEGACADGEGEAKTPAAPPSTIIRRLETLLAPTLEAGDLSLLTPPTRGLLEAGKVFATHNVNGQRLHAQINLENDQMYLHHLQDQTLPAGAAVVQLEEVVPATPPCLAFLDLEWPNSASRRVLIRLNPDTPLGRQFIWLCTGQRGPCYANTLFFQVKYSGQPGERVSGGDYERNNGKGGAPLLPDLDKGDYRESRQAGAVHPVWRGGSKSEWNSRFGILTKDLGEEGEPVNTVFGEVEDGFEVVKEAAQHDYIYQVTVAECGILLGE